MGEKTHGWDERGHERIAGSWGYPEAASGASASEALRLKSCSNRSPQRALTLCLSYCDPIPLAPRASALRVPILSGPCLTRRSVRRDPPTPLPNTNGLQPGLDCPRSRSHRQLTMWLSRCGNKRYAESWRARTSPPVSRGKGAFRFTRRARSSCR
jgi:hypothetical protein